MTQNRHTHTKKPRIKNKPKLIRIDIKKQNKIQEENMMAYMRYKLHKSGDFNQQRNRK